MLCHLHVEANLSWLESRYRAVDSFSNPRVLFVSLYALFSETANSGGALAPLAPPAPPLFTALR